MPELPEVQTIVSDLQRKIIGLKIVKVDVQLKKIIKSPVRFFIDTVQGSKVVGVRRRGKLLIFDLDGKGQYMLIHLRMTGQLIYRSKDAVIAGGHSTGSDLQNLPNKYSHVIFSFSDKSQLFFNDQRQFGVVKLVDEKGLQQELEKYGVEPLDSEFSLRQWQQMLFGKTTEIKAFLLDQKKVTGIGNIYADEILFAAKVKPGRKIDSLSLAEVKALHDAIRIIIRKAIKYRGTTFNDYVDADGNRGNYIRLLKVYHRDGQHCLRCEKGVIQKKRIAGRGTHFCNKCQK